MFTQHRAPTSSPIARPSATCFMLDADLGDRDVLSLVGGLDCAEPVVFANFDPRTVSRAVAQAPMLTRQCAGVVRFEEDRTAEPDARWLIRCGAGGRGGRAGK